MPTKWATNVREERPDSEGVFRTRYKLLGYQRQGGRHDGRWRVIDLQTGAAIGPQYVYRSELLADLDRFAEVYGY